VTERARRTDADESADRTAADDANDRSRSTENSRRRWGDAVASLHKAARNSAIQRTVVDTDQSESRYRGPDAAADVPGPVTVRTDDRVRQFLDRENATAAARGSEIRVKPEAACRDGAKRLLAHELAHLRQQQAADRATGAPARQEADAESFASDVVASRPTDVSVSAPTGWAFQEETDHRAKRIRVDLSAERVTIKTTAGGKFDYELTDTSLEPRLRPYDGRVEDGKPTVQARGEFVLEWGAALGDDQPAPGAYQFDSTFKIVVREGGTGESSEAIETEPVVEPTPLDLPDWIPPRARQAIELNDYDMIANREVRDGLYQFPDAGDGPFGDVIVWTEDMGSGYRAVEAFQMYPDDPSYYRQFAEDSEFQVKVFHDVFTQFNHDLWWYVNDRGLSISQARVRIRENAKEHLKLVFQAAVGLFEAGFGGIGMAGGAGGAAGRGRARDGPSTSGKPSKSSGKSSKSSGKSSKSSGKSSKSSGKQSSSKRSAKRTRSAEAEQASKNQSSKRPERPGGKTKRQETPVVAPFGKSVQDDLVAYWNRRIDETSSSSDKAKYRRYIDRIENKERPTPTQSEEEIGYLYRKIGKGNREVSYKAGRSASHGEKGSTRPDVVNERQMVEVKRVKPENKGSLHKKLEKQIADRATEGPAGYKQTIVVDVRGLDIPASKLKTVAKEIVSDVNKSLASRSMKNLPKLSPEDIQFVTW